MGKDAFGFTLLELMVVLALGVLMLTLGLPAFAQLQQRVRVAAAHHQLTASLASARSTAITLGQPVTLCPSADGRQCSDDVVWEDGWILFADPGRTGVPASAEAVLRYTGPLAGTLTIRSSRGRRRVRYLPSGLSHGSNLTLRICSATARLLGKVVVNNTGRIRSRQVHGDAACG